MRFHMRVGGGAISVRGLGVVAIFMSVLVALGGVAHGKPMDPVDDDWDYVEEAMALVGGSDAYREGPPYVGQSFIDANFFFGSTMQATPEPTIAVKVTVKAGQRCYQSGAHVREFTCTKKGKRLVWVKSGR